ncbi:MAG: tRNA (adenosine(37)-N6)-dimethylallyltransferase MiaA [Candidatus Paceibacterota bacterium]
MKLSKLIVVCGPTATGKSDYAVTLAKEQNGEIISADSRQVYKGLDIGSGKITAKEMKGVPHHLINVANPKRTFSVVRYKKLADKIIADIIKRGKTPIIVGGTGFYIDAVVFNQQLPEVKPNKVLRKELEKHSLFELQEKLQQLDNERYETIDIHNKVRLIRAIEIATALGSVPKVDKHSPYEVEWIYLDHDDEVLKERIHDRLLKRMRKGMVKEVEQLHEQGVAWSRLEALGLEYRYIALYLQNKLSNQAHSTSLMAGMLEQLETAIWQYAKRQRTWFKKYAK